MSGSGPTDEAIARAMVELCAAAAADNNALSAIKDLEQMVDHIRREAYAQGVAAAAAPRIGRTIVLPRRPQKSVDHEIIIGSETK